MLIEIARIYIHIYTLVYKVKYKLSYNRLMYSGDLAPVMTFLTDVRSFHDITDICYSINLKKKYETVLRLSKKKTYGRVF